MKRVGALLGVAMAAACGSVELPEEHFYRLAYPNPSGGFVAHGPSLRVERLELAAHLTGDRLLVAQGPVLLRPYQFHRWAGSLENLVADALVTGLVRSQAFALVRAPAEPGQTELMLSGRVLEMQQVVQGDRWSGRVVLDLALADAHGNLLFRDEMRSDVPVAVAQPEAVVEALSLALGHVVDQLLDRAGSAGVLAHAAAAAPR